MLKNILAVMIFFAHILAGKTLDQKQRFQRNAQRRYLIFWIFHSWRKYHIFRNTKIKGNIIFSIISDIFSQQIKRAGF